MRKVVAAEFLSLYGVMESPDKWHLSVDSRTFSTGVLYLTYRPAQGRIS